MSKSPPFPIPCHIYLELVEMVFVGTDDSPHKRRKEKDRKEKDVVGQAHQEVDTEEGQRQCEQEQGHCSQGCKRNT